MKIQLVWFSDPFSEAIKEGLCWKTRRVLQEFGFEVESDIVAEKDVYPGMRSNVLGFECEDPMKLAMVARTIERELVRHYNVQPTVLIDGMGALEYACRFAETHRLLEQAATKAVAELRATRSWLKDRRIGEIRRDLERAL